ncbi:hypothetical protein GCM10027567_27260 [Spongiibacter taiwanensis]
MQALLTARLQVTAVLLAGGFDLPDLITGQLVRVVVGEYSRARRPFFKGQGLLFHRSVIVVRRVFFPRLGLTPKGQDQQKGKQAK